MQSDRRQSWFRMLLMCFAVFLLVFATQTFLFWHHGRLMAGTDVDGPLHYTIQLGRLYPSAFANDLVFQDTADRGPYERTYAMIRVLMKWTGCSLLAANLLVCWFTNALYLAGVIVLLRKLRLSPLVCGVGVFLASLPFDLTGGVLTGVKHALVIPHQIWLWPLPWFLVWFTFGMIRGPRMMLFYGLIGGLWAMTYPLYGMLFGVAFGAADLVRLLRQKSYSDIAWLAGAVALCGGLAAWPSLKVLQNNQVNLLQRGELPPNLAAMVRGRSVYWAKAFRRLILFAVLGGLALRQLRKEGHYPTLPLQQLSRLMAVCLIVCVSYGLVQLVLPSVALLCPGRLSLVFYLILATIIAVWLQYCYRPRPGWMKALTIAGLLLTWYYAIRYPYQLRAKGWLSADPEFAEFGRLVKSKTDVNDALIIPPGSGTDYFRVYAERSLWVHPDDCADKSSAIIRRKEERVHTLKQFYDPVTPGAERESILRQLHAEGVNYVVTRDDMMWSETLSWPVILHSGRWELHGPASR